MKKRLARFECSLMTMSAVVVGALFIICGFFSSVLAQHPAKPDADSERLHQVGETVARAVLAKDATTLLQYDRSDLRTEDESSLKNTKSDLYCFLFDSSCISGKGRSVFDKLSSSRELAIKIVDGGKSKIDGLRYATLLFYDKSTISEASLHSRTYLCKEGITRIASWTFKLADGKWVPVTPLFDSETDTLCSPD
jgi:hypothetical protein